VDVIGDLAIVLYNRPRVDDAIFSDYRIRIDNDIWHHYGPAPDACRRRNNGSLMNKDSGHEPVFQCTAKTLGSSTVITYSNNEGISVERIQAFCSADDRKITNCGIDSTRIVVKEQNALETSGAAGYIQNNLSVPPSTPNH
jgi:hypothetical protein